ncbi:MAG: ribosome maturation factor RimM [Bacteroidaceae bacterium]|nr:ribosome maturation factor RimM [Bacteroidaceae bacterium]
MITEQELFSIGKLIKTHGTAGEIIANFDAADAYALADADFFVLQMDGLYVPFFVKSYKARSNNSALISFDGVDNMEQAETKCGKELFLHNRFAGLLAEDEEPSLLMLKGFEIIDSSYGVLGTVSDIDDRTANLLFVVDGKNGEILLPAADAFVRKIDVAKHKLYTKYPLDMPI